MIRILYRHRSTGIVAELPPEKLQTAVQDKLINLWVDMVAPTEAEWKHVLEECFHFHPLAVEDAVQDAHTPKLDDFSTYLFLVFHSISLGEEPMDLVTDETDVFLGPNYLITMHDTPGSVIDRMMEVSFHEVHGLFRGPAYLLYEILDRQVDEYIPLIDQFEEQLDKLGDDIFLRSTGDKPEVLDRLLTAKSSALRLRRIIIPQREIVGRLATNDYPVIPSDLRIYFRDVYDHFLRLSDLLDGTRDLAGSTIETYLALVSNRMNEVMKLLAMFSAIFIPLSFIASVYGMNFNIMPELSWKYGYLMVWGIFALVIGVEVYVFHRRGWLKLPGQKTD